MSRKMRAVRRSEPKARRRCRIARQRASIAANPDVQAARAESISRTRKGMGERISKVASEAYRRKSTRAKAASLANLRHGRTSAMKRKAAASRADRQSSINRKIAAGVKANWQNTPESVKRERIVKALTAGAKSYSLINGEVKRFHSSWEAACADVLISVGRKYKTQRAFKLGDVTYVADFVLYGKIIIEVKGAPRARERWERVTFPAIRRHLDPAWSVYVADFKPDRDYGSFQEFLNDLSLVN